MIYSKYSAKLGFLNNSEDKMDSPEHLEILHFLKKKIAIDAAIKKSCFLSDLLAGFFFRQDTESKNIMLVLTTFLSVKVKLFILSQGQMKHL